MGRWSQLLSRKVLTHVDKQGVDAVIICAMATMVEARNLSVFALV